MQPTPGLLRKSAVSVILNGLNSYHEGGPWALVAADTYWADGATLTELRFACGMRYQDPPVDKPERVVIITVTERNAE